MAHKKNYSNCYAVRRAAGIEITGELVYRGSPRLETFERAEELRPNPLFFPRLQVVVRLCVEVVLDKFQWISLSSFTTKAAPSITADLRQYRLRNLTICMTHSAISGGFIFFFAITHYRLMFNNPVTYWEPYMKYIFQITAGYFLHDALDMLNHEFSTWTLELLFHHAATIFVFLCPVCSHDFAIFGYWGLLMEVNSIFLHMRTIHQLSGRSKSHPTEYEVVKYLNLITFVFFRFVVQIFPVHFTYTYQQHFVYFYKVIGLYGSAFFFILNVILFYRVLASDGFLGREIQEMVRKSSRDKDKDK